jgi:hypothetical protein
MSPIPKIGAPAQRALQGAGILKLEQLTKVSEAELLGLHGMGQKALGILRQTMMEHDLSFRVQAAGQLEPGIRAALDNIRSTDGALQTRSFLYLLDITERPVSWAYEAWDELVAGLTHKDNHVRAISSQLLANLAKSDPKGRILRDFNKLLAVTKDERFVTARHCLQSLWKVGAAGKKQQKALLEGFKQRFEECQAEKNCTLIRYDLIRGLRDLYDATTDELVKETALVLIETETDLKYRKKYAGVWR